MAITEILPGIHYVGVNDRTTTRFEALWSLPMGVSYNAYLVAGEKIALIDTVEESFGSRLEANISEAIGERKIDYLVIYNSIAWKEGLLIFDNTLMSEVVKRLERWYGVQIEVENKELLAYRFTATFKSESLDRVLNVLKISSDIDYQINDTLVRLKL